MKAVLTRKPGAYLQVVGDLINLGALNLFSKPFFVRFIVLNPSVVKNAYIWLEPFMTLHYFSPERAYFLQISPHGWS